MGRFDSFWLEALYFTGSGAQDSLLPGNMALAWAEVGSLLLWVGPISRHVRAGGKGGDTQMMGKASCSEKRNGGKRGKRALPAGSGEQVGRRTPLRRCRTDLRLGSAIF